MRDSKACYKKVRRIIKYNTLNTEQGPTVNKGHILDIACRTFDRKTIETAISMLQQNEEVLAIKRGNNTHLTLWDDPHLLAIIENETKKDSPNKDLIGHINKMRMP